MPDEDKNEELAVVSKATALRKAGMPTAAVILIAAMSFPGFWEFFFNRTDDEAKIKAEVSYQMLKAQTEGLAEQMRESRREVTALRDLLTQLLMQRAAVGVKLPPPAELSHIDPLPASLDERAVEGSAAGQEAMASAGIADLNL